MVITRAKSRGNLAEHAANGAAKASPALQNGLQGNRARSTDRENGHSPVKQSKVEKEDKQPVQGRSAAYDAAPRTTSYEFLGPPGAFLISTGVPFFTYFCALGCNEKGCPPLPLLQYFAEGWKAMQTSEFWLSLWDTKGIYAYLAWYVWCIACWAVLPGKWLEGSKMRNGEKLWYKTNALATFFASMVACGVAYYLYGDGPFLFIFDHWVGLITGSLLLAIIEASYCYAVSFVPGTMLAEGGNSGNILYDWFIGRILNPRIGQFDIKTFNELRPGLILWFILDIALAVKQRADFGRITDSMVLILLFQGVYVVDAVYNEAGILTQMDITTDGFGFMLAVGDSPWVPFTYALQARYLAMYPVDLGLLGTTAVLAVNATGYYIFRVSNGDKNDFRNGKNPKNLSSMTTERGTSLITSGWWGRSRHPNYLGDWIMAWAWCLPTGFKTPLTYFYVVYFAVLLVHRQLRDDEACHRKYGKDWDRYCQIVKWRIVPGLY